MNTIFDFLPDEDIFKICEGLDDQSLIRLIKSNSNFYHICRDIIIQRKSKHEESLIKTLEDKIESVANGRFENPEEKLRFKKDVVNGEISILIAPAFYTKSGYVEVTQTIPSDVDEPWPLDITMKIPNYYGGVIKSDYFDVSDKALLRKVAEFIVKGGYNASS